MNINVLLADGRKLVREGLCLLLEKHRDLHVIAEADGSPAAVKLVRALPVDVVVLNLAPPAHGGSEAVAALLAANPQVKVVVLTHNPSSDLVTTILGAGALACLTKDAAGKQLVAAVRAAAAGEAYTPAPTARAKKSGRRGSGATMRPLAAREREILRLIAGGETTKEIAYSLGVSTKTIETHRRRIMLKLNRHSVAELTKYAVLEGISPLESPV